MAMLKITRSTLKTIENNLQRINLFFCELLHKNQDKKAFLFTRHFMKTLVLFLTLFFSLSVVMANQDINMQKLELQKKFISTINQCSNPEQLDQFIKNAVKNISNSTERARHAALLEELIKYNPSCFVASVKKLDIKTCEKIEESYLSEPFFYPIEDLRASLASVKDYKASCLAS